MVQPGLRIPERLYEPFVKAAASEGRSLNAQVLKLIEDYLESRKRSERAKAAAARKLGTEQEGT